MLQQSTNALGRLAMLVLPAAAILAQSTAFDPAIFKAPPAMYRGHAWPVGTAIDKVAKHPTYAAENR